MTVSKQELVEQIEAALEAEYRRGFCAGWEKASEAIHLVGEGEGLGLEVAYNHAGEFLDDVLTAWQKTNPYRAIPAPSLAGE